MTMTDEIKPGDTTEARASRRVSQEIREFEADERPKRNRHWIGPGK
jgi:hypothetical protein